MKINEDYVRGVAEILFCLLMLASNLSGIFLDE